MINKKNINVIIFLSSIVFLFIILGLTGIIKITNPFKRNELKLEETQVLVDDIKIIAQLFTFSYYTEIVIDSTKKIDGVFSDYDHQVVIVARGTSYIGTDLSNLDTSNIKVINNKDGLECTLIVPKAKIFNTVINPSGFTIFKDCKKFTPEEIQLLKNKGITEIEKNAIESGMLERGNERTKKLFEDLLTSMGYSKIIVLFK